MIRFAILFFTLFFVFLALIIGPVIVAPIMGPKFFNDMVDKSVIPMSLMQPANQTNNNTIDQETGTGRPGYPTASPTPLPGLVNRALF